MHFDRSMEVLAELAAAGALPEKTLDRLEENPKAWKDLAKGAEKAWKTLEKSVKSARKRF